MGWFVEVRLSDEHTETRRVERLTDLVRILRTHRLEKEQGVTVRGLGDNERLAIEKMLKGRR